MIRTSLMTDGGFEAFIANHPISGGKGDDTAKSTEESQAAFTNTLQQAFKANNATQQGQLNFLNNTLQSAITNPQGYSPATLAAMRTQATEAAAQNNKNVMQAVNEKNATQAGGDPTALPSGVQEQIQAGVGSQIANNESNQQLGITEQNGQLQNQNKWQALQDEERVADLENPEGMASGDNSAASTVGGLSQAVTQANGPGIGSILGGVVGAGLGAVSGGIGNLDDKGTSTPGEQVWNFVKGL
jgi:hypothetical protein